MSTGQLRWQVRNSQSVKIVFKDLSVKIRPQGGQLQPTGCDECSDVEEGIQGRGRPAAEDAAQYPPQG